MPVYPIVDFGSGFLAAAELNAKVVAPINDLDSRLAVVEAHDQFASKTADQTVSASATLVDDTHLTFPVAANSTYTFEALLLVTHSTDAADLKYAFTFPASAVLHVGQSGANNAAITGAGTSGSGEYIARQAQTSPSTFIPLAGSTNILGVTVRGLLVVAATAGTLKLQWAQNTATGTTTLKLGSWMALTKRA